MIEKIPFEITQGEYEGKKFDIKSHASPYDIQVKVNQLVDAVNTIQKEREAERFEIQEWIGILEAVRKSVNIHEKQIDELQMKLEPKKCEPETFVSIDEALKMGKKADPYAEQRRWIGKLCKFWDDDAFVTSNDWAFGMLTSIDKGMQYQYCCNENCNFKHCEPVKPDDDIIYKGE